MNHSPRFHALVDSYTGGREAAFERELRDFAWPMPK
jgi:predicted metal-dependent hydrolase